MSNIDRYKLITQYPKDKFFDIKQVFKFDSYEAIRILNELDKKCEVLEKALELACERVKYFEEMQDKEMGFFELFGYDSNYDLQAIIKEYKEEALKELEK